MNLLETVKSREEARAQVVIQLQALDNAISSVDDAYITTIANIRYEKFKVLEALDKRHEWVFNFEGGGWNTVYAHTKEEAIIDAKYTYGERMGMAPDTKSFTMATPELVNALMMNFD